MSPNSSKTQVGKTYETLKWTVLQGDADGLQQAVTSSTWSWSILLAIGILLFVIVAGIIETGTFFGVVFPSNLVLSASVIAFVMMKNRWMVLLVILISIIATMIGDQVGYYTGTKLGAWLYDKKDTRYFKKKYFISAQEALNKKGKKIIYVGRFMSFWFLLPTIFGMMKRDKKDFFKLSTLSAILWKLSITIPLITILLIFPSLKIGILLILCMIIPEITGWIILLKPEAEKYFERLSNAKEQINAIRADVKAIGGHFSEIVEKLKTPSEAELSIIAAPTVLQENPETEETIVLAQDTSPDSSFISLAQKTVDWNENRPSTVQNYSTTLQKDKTSPQDSYLKKLESVAHSVWWTMSHLGWKTKEIWWKLKKKASNVGSSITEKIPRWFTFLKAEDNTPTTNNETSTQ